MSRTTEIPFLYFSFCLLTSRSINYRTSSIQQSFFFTFLPPRPFTTTEFNRLSVFIDGFRLCPQSFAAGSFLKWFGTQRDRFLVKRILFPTPVFTGRNSSTGPLDLLLFRCPRQINRRKFAVRYFWTVPGIPLSIVCRSKSVESPTTWWYNPVVDVCFFGKQQLSLTPAQLLYTCCICYVRAQRVDNYSKRSRHPWVLSRRNAITSLDILRYHARSLFILPWCNIIHYYTHNAGNTGTKRVRTTRIIALIRAKRCAVEWYGEKNCQTAAPLTRIFGFCAGSKQNKKQKHKYPYMRN